MQNPQGFGSAPPPASPAGTSSTGLQPNIAALLSYVWIPVTSIVFYLIEKNNNFVRFHAVQSLLYGISIIVMSIVLMIVLMVTTGVLAAVSDTLGGIFALVSFFIWIALFLALFAGWLFLMFKAYQGQMFKLPIIGNLAEKFAAK